MPSILEARTINRFVPPEINTPAIILFAGVMKALVEMPSSLVMPHEAGLALHWAIPACVEPLVSIMVMPQEAGVVLHCAMAVCFAASIWACVNKPQEAGSVLQACFAASICACVNKLQLAGLVLH